MQSLDDQRVFRINKVRRCKSTRRIEIDIGFGTADGTVDFNSTLDR